MVTELMAAVAASTVHASMSMGWAWGVESVVKIAMVTEWRCRCGRGGVVVAG
jgi:hypothetical protein